MERGLLFVPGFPGYRHIVPVFRALLRENLVENVARTEHVTVRLEDVAFFVVKDKDVGACFGNRFRSGRIDGPCVVGKTGNVPLLGTGGAGGRGQSGTETYTFNE